MNRIHYIYWHLLVLLLVLFIPQYSIADEREQKDDIIIENTDMRLIIGKEGKARSLIHKATGEECLTLGTDVPLCAITQYRPYDNENFLMFPAKPRVFPSNKIERHDNELHVEFQDTYDIVVIELNITDYYIGFSLKQIDYRIEDFGVKRKTEIDEIALLQLPVKKRENFGEWLNVTWDEQVAVNVLGTHATTRIDAFQYKDYMTMYAGLDFKVKLFNSGAALITTSKEKLLICIDKVERDYGMPLGVESRQNKEYKYSYYELRDVTTQNIDEHIEYAKKGGFKSVVVYYVDFAKACGHYEWKDKYPNGMKDLQEITSKIKAAGMIPGIHIHYSKIAVNDPYINNGIPDSRTNHVREFILSEPLNATSTTITVEGSLEDVRMEKGRRLLHIDNELITYEGYTTEPPYQFTGCTRSVFNSKAAPHNKGQYFRLLDVDDWPLFIRINQNTSIQKEIAERIGKIYNEAGFRFVYFDGAEDVPMPYWYNVSRSQMVVYNEMKPAPLFAEGALKSHYGWHILSRGNAFDTFPPERIRPAMKKYTLRCAEQIAKDFTSVNFGWINYLAPDEKTIGTQPSMYEYICSKAVAWDSPISLVGNLEDLREHPRTEDNLHVIKMWEEAKLQGAITEQQKEMLKNPEQEYILLKDKKGKYNLYPYQQITTDEEKPIQAFIFQREGKTCIVYWHMTGSGKLALNIEKSKLMLTNENGKKISFQSIGGKSILPAANRLFVEIDLFQEQAVKLFKAGIELIK
jgi:hypothetical protein